MLPRQHRLTRPEDFRAVFRRGADLRTRRRSGTPLLVVQAAFPGTVPSERATDSSRYAAPTRPPRVGFVVSRAVGSSVVRHRVIRRLRAQMAARIRDLPTGADVVVRAAPAAATASSAELGEALDRSLSAVLKARSTAGVVA